MSFISGIKTEVKDLLQASAAGALYLSRASAEGLAGRPAHKIALFKEGVPMLPLFEGGLVAVDFPLPADAEGVVRQQRTWLPVMDADNKPIKLGSITSRDVNDSIQRAIVKAIAMVQGVGAAAFLGYKETKAMLVELGLRPDSELTATKAYTKTLDDGTSYVPWMASVIAARLTDPAFHWEVAMGHGFTEETPYIPAFKVGNGWMVQIKARYKGLVRTEWLPLMDNDAGHAAVPNPTVFDWNTAVMRGLTKLIAYLTGYGIDTYAGEDLENLVPKQVGNKSAAQPAKAQQAKPESAPPAQVAAVTAPDPQPQALKEPPAADGAPATVTPATPPAMSENLKANLERVKTVTDVSRLQGAKARAQELFGHEAPLFKQAVEKRLAELEAMAATA